jgi:hypothetical protein
VRSPCWRCRQRARTGLDGLLLALGLTFCLGIAAVVAVVPGFMRLPASPPLTHAFVIVVLFWLAVLLSLGGMDPFTRIDYPVPVTRYP